MRILKYSLYLLIMASVFTACKKNPTACFVIDKADVAVGSPINCDASCSKHAKEYIWLGTGDKVPNNESASKETFKFDAPGTYFIKLQVTNGGKDDIISHRVTVY